MIGLVRKSSAPESSAALWVAEIAERGQEQDRRVAADGERADPAAGLEAVHPRHQHVEQDQVGPLLVEQRQRLLRRPRPGSPA